MFELVGHGLPDNDDGRTRLSILRPREYRAQMPGTYIELTENRQYEFRILIHHPDGEERIKKSDAVRREDPVNC